MENDWFPIREIPSEPDETRCPYTITLQDGTVMRCSLKNDRVHHYHNPRTEGTDKIFAVVELPI